jgi:hypothetical protein
MCLHTVCTVNRVVVVEVEVEGDGKRLRHTLPITIFTNLRKSGIHLPLLRGKNHTHTTLSTLCLVPAHHLATPSTHRCRACPNPPEPVYFATQPRATQQQRSIIPCPIATRRQPDSVTQSGNLCFASLDSEEKFLEPIVTTIWRHVVEDVCGSGRYGDVDRLSNWLRIFGKGHTLVQSPF